MSDSEEIVTNPLGGKQSKLYVAYHLIDPHALEALAAIHHRGAIKYAPDNWRKIDTEEHINHALHHIVQALKITGARRRGLLYAHDKEDHLAHALCRITFAIAMETEQHDGVHPEHSDPRYHEPKTTSAERNPVRDTRPECGPVPTTPGFDERARGFAALTNTPGRDYPERPPKVRRGSTSKFEVDAVRRSRRR